MAMKCNDQTTKVQKLNRSEFSQSTMVPYIVLTYKSLSRISRPLKVESVCGPKSLTRV